MPEIRTKLTPKTALKSQLLTHIRFSDLMELPESDFAKLVVEIEGDPLFQKLFYTPDRETKIISRKRLPNTRLSSSLLEFKEEISAGKENVDVESLLKKHKGIVSLVQKIGQKNFEDYFLYGTAEKSIEEIASVCGITFQEAKEIQSMLLDLSIHAEFFNPSTMTGGGIHYTPIAKIEIGEDHHFIFSFFSPHLAFGPYLIDNEKLKSVKKFLDPDERKILPNLLAKIEWVNLRQNTNHKILTEIVHAEENYLKTRDMEKMTPISQRELAKRIGVAPSTVSRAIFGKSLIMPWGEEKSLKELFINRKEWVEKLLGKILDKNKESTDLELKNLFEKRYGIKIARRTMNQYRNDIMTEKKKKALIQNQ